METNVTMMSYEDARTEEIQRLAAPYQSENGNLDIARFKKDVKTQWVHTQRMLALKDIICKWQSMLWLGMPSMTFTIPESLKTAEMYDFKEFGLDLTARIPIGALIQKPLFSNYKPQSEWWSVNGMLNTTVSAIKGDIGEDGRTITLYLGHLDSDYRFQREENGFYAEINPDATCNWLYDELMSLCLHLTDLVDKQMKDKMFGFIDICQSDPDLRKYDVRYYCDLKYILEDEAA